MGFSCKIRMYFRSEQKSDIIDYVNVFWRTLIQSNIINNIFHMSLSPNGGVLMVQIEFNNCTYRKFRDLITMLSNGALAETIYDYDINLDSTRPLGED